MSFKTVACDNTAKTVISELLEFKGRVLQNGYVFQAFVTKACRLIC